MYSHTGTHVDPPAHICADGLTLEAFPPKQFIGKALIVDCRHLTEGGLVSMETLIRTKPLSELWHGLISINLGVKLWML